MHEPKKILVVSSGDLRLDANQVGWKFQEKMEQQLETTLKEFGFEILRGHTFDSVKQHGFIDSQKMGMEVFRTLDPNAPIIVAESVWQYTHHVLPGLMSHKGPILTLANWEGMSSGLVGMLNLNGSLTKAEVAYSTLWSKDFQDEFFKEKLSEWLNTGTITQDDSHVSSFESLQISESQRKRAEKFAYDFHHRKAIMGVFDEGCMGMFNAIVPDKLLNKLGIFKERLSQSALYAEMLNIADSEAQQILDWLIAKGMTFNWGSNPVTELTKEQTLDQCKMYIAAVRISDQFGCDTIGIQYQQGLKDLAAASDLAEGLLNNMDRPPVFDTEGKELYPKTLIPHFNEVDECAGIDALITTQLWQELGQAPETTLHDIRWGEEYLISGEPEFVWVFLISGAAPPAHFVGGYAGASSERQPPMYFKKGGGSLKGLSKPGNIVWSRIYVESDALCCDIGIGEVVSLPEEETQRRWENTTPAWPIMHAVLPGISKNQMMARHKANHIQVIYANSKEMAVEAAKIKATVFNSLGIKTFVCGALK
ncbi:L-fucose isomerase-like protein [Algoriphagus ratkowskyi]|uniref:Fucose isomerase n=1 Tax=Algoriphagus ratkowskyi TaxID=57028 RepID=A0A2W7RBG7_9BACT|nr:fucose isomerase [Algoriphagus ratkowskyi]PZX53077.1 L-fucose isomerase-like protein [Algoriphagus ratkowskyi]TXD76357.1 fucose isomerase [Algoriphagus ratkowskyi]